MKICIRKQNIAPHQGFVEMSKLYIVIDFADVADGVFSFLLVGSTLTPLHFCWELLNNPNDIELLNKTGIIPEENKFQVDGEFAITYQLKTELNACVGSHRDIYLNYPFANENEAFVSAGSLPELVGEFPGAIKVDLVNIPKDWQVYSNLEPMHAAKLASFFVYISQAEAPLEAIHKFKNGNTLALRWQVQVGKTVPLSFAEILPWIHNWLDFLEEKIGAYTKTEALNILVLQVPFNFQELVSAPTFATGENMMNGIVCYAPPDEDYLEIFFGYRDYGYFLLDGIVHELAHLYASAGDAACKSILYAASDTARHARQLIGEALPGYIHRLYLFAHYQHDLAKFFTQEVVHWLNLCVQRGRASLLFRWLLLDIHLQTRHQSSVLQVFAAMIDAQLANEQAFTSQEIIFEALQRLDIQLSDVYRNLLRPDFAGDIADLLNEALPAIGMKWVQDAKHIIIEGNLTNFSLD